MCVRTAGDVNGDGYAGVIVGAPLATADQSEEGRAFIYYGNNRPGRTRQTRQLLTDYSPIAILGTSDSETAFGILTTVLTVVGQTRLAIEYEIKPFGVPFDGLNTTSSGFVDPYDIGGHTVIDLVDGLDPGTLSHWRRRVVYDMVKTPLQCHGPWVHIPVNGWNEADLRTAGDPKDVEAAAEPLVLLRPEAQRPDPVGGRAEINCALPQEREGRLAAHDVLGRQVAVLKYRINLVWFY